MKYQGVCIAVSDVKLSRKFYQDLFGLQVFQDYGICVMFDCGLSLQQNFEKIADIPKDSIVTGSHNMELYFEEDDFDSFVEKLSEYKDIICIGGVKEQPWGQRSVRFYDLDKHIIEVGENSKFVVKRFLDSRMTLEEVSAHMDISVSDLKKLLEAE